ncbi:hypothetical protein B6N60_05085 [Richelia sinica FACHB-800]|uniref:Uncharacterized protein n=1 Tax=Richelia sinica FACHB-800 TaxID=1357546 RepID=A0A975Y7I3_9NOST|nr:hypothetical protein B6N60_05085 [Richelia sinica FACHB-800]
MVIGEKNKLKFSHQLSITNHRLNQNLMCIFDAMGT